MPILIDEASVFGQAGPVTGATTSFEAIPLEDTKINESWLQHLLFRHPELLPLTGADQMFAPLRAVAREVPTDVGPIDFLGISPSGFLTIVETKLRRNPQSRREVLGQLLDYCANLAESSYEDLVRAVVSAKHRANDADDPLIFAAKGGNASLAEQQRFRSNVVESLSHGRFLMMIVGDGYRESTANLVEYLQKLMHLQFTVRIVELQLYRQITGDDTRILVVPRLAARTQEVTRGIVRIKPSVSLSDIKIESGGDQDTSPGLETFLEHMQNTTPAADDFESLLTELKALEIHPDPTKDGISLRWADPSGSGKEFRIFRARRNGHVRFGLLVMQLEKQGYSAEPALRFVREVASWVDGVTVAPTGAILARRSR